MLVIALFFLFSFKAEAQKITYTGETLPEFIEKPDSCQNDCEEIMQNALTQLHQAGYIEASLDSLKQQGDTLLLAHWHIGQQYSWQNIGTQQIANGLLRKLKLRGRSKAELESGKLSFENFKQKKRFETALLRQLENTGYPFAQLKIDSLQISGNKISGAWQLQRNDRISIDTILVTGDAKISQRFIENYLSIEEGDLYNEKKIKSISKRINELPFLENQGRPQVIFNREKASIELFVKKREASKFDLVLGILPKSENEGGGYEIVGDGEIALANALGQGEFFSLNYESYSAKGRELKTQFKYPFLPFVPFGLDTKFDIYVKDTLFRQIGTYVGLQYNLGGSNFFQFFYENKNSSLISIDTTQILASRQLPENLDIRRNYYGLQYQWQNLDYLFNPQKGWNLSFKTALGTKLIRENVTITTLKDTENPNLDFGSLYDSLDTKQLQTKIEMTVQRFWQMGKRGSLLTGVRGAILRSLNAENRTNTADLYQNEQFLIGGNALLRGFDEQSITADWYAVTSLEYRFLMGRNSNIFVFADVAFRENGRRATDNYRFDTPFGFGAGVNLETKAGILQMSYALGAQQGNAIQLRTGKVHFGYVNYF